MTTKIEMVAPRDVFIAIEAGARKSPVLMETAMKRTQSRWRSRVKKGFKALPGKPKSPLRWKPAKVQDKPPNTRFGYYSKQKAAYFATKGFRRGIPSTRTNKMINSWKIKHTQGDMGGVYTMVNTSGYEEFVTGIHQQPFHQDTGWYQSQEVIAEAWVELENVLIETWFTVVDGVVT